MTILLQRKVESESFAQFLLITQIFVECGSLLFAVRILYREILQLTAASTLALLLCSTAYLCCFPPFCLLGVDSCEGLNNTVDCWSAIKLVHRRRVRRQLIFCRRRGHGMLASG